MHVSRYLSDAFSEKKSLISQFLIEFMIDLFYYYSSLIPRSKNKLSGIPLSAGKVCIFDVSLGGWTGISAGVFINLLMLMVSMTLTVKRGPNLLG